MEEYRFRFPGLFAALTRMLRTRTQQGRTSRAAPASSVSSTEPGAGTFSGAGYRIRHPVIDRHNAEARLKPGTQTLIIRREAFPKPPLAATGVEFCLNGDRTVPARNPTNNVKLTGLSLGRNRRWGLSAPVVAGDFETR